jgi:tricorn protease
MKNVLFFLFIIISYFITVPLSAQNNNAMWLRYPSISPDGSKIAFGYKGDIYIVAAQGGNATPITIHEAHDMMPIWSKDGNSIAFASDRYGNFDVFVMPATGGTPTRLTYHGSGDYPYDFSPDSKQVIFGSARQTDAKNIRFYSPRLFQNLYKVSIKGGRPVLISQAGVEHAHYNSNATKIVFQDRKGYEDPWRKHHTSSVTRDIWVMDVKTNTYTQISNFEGEDREPVFSNDNESVFYLSEKNNSTQNLYKQNIATKAEQPLTQFKNHPVRHLSISKNNILCFTYNGEIYTLQEGNTPNKIAVAIQNDGRANIEKNVSINSNVNEFALSPNGKEIAFVTRGEVFVTSVDGGITKRITNTPQQERHVQWAPDGKTLIYAAERNNNWDIYTSSIAKKEEPYFYASTLLKEEAIINTNKEEFLPKYSPDGKEIAYIEERNILKVYNVAGKQSRTILPEGRNYSYADGDHDFNWSADSKYIIADDDMGNWASTHTAFIKADGSQTNYPIMSGFSEGNPKLHMNGQLLTWVSSREGRKSLALQGSRELDIYGAFLDKDAYDKFKLNKEDYALWKEIDEKNKKSDSSKTKKDTLNKKWNPDFTSIEDRQVRLTINSASISDYVMSTDGSKVFYMAAFEKGYDVWVTEPRTRETKILAKLGGSGSNIEMSKDGKNLFVVNSGSLMKIDAESGKPTPIAINGEMILNAASERNYIYEHAWRQVQKKFYDPNIHDIDWPMYKENYATFLPHISNNYDFQELLSEILGELNGSHTGGRYSPQMQNPDVTAALGLLYDETYTGSGLKVTEVIAGGPFDKANSKIKAGNIIQRIDGETITDDIDWAKLLNRKTGKLTLISATNPVTNTTIDERIKPISFSEEIGLLYKRWLKRMNEMVDKLSNGKVGYVHVQGMNDGSFRTVYDEVMGKNYEKQALIVDTRFNGGGWLHDDLNNFLSGKRYLDFAPQGHRLKDAEPLNRWTKPSCVLMSEGNYSDAFIFPFTYKELGIGKLIGTPVAGTGTAVWWETQIDPTLVFGIPMVATIGKANRASENLQVDPDIKVTLPYEAFLQGNDLQLEAAVKEMLKTIN